MNNYQVKLYDQDGRPIVDGNIERHIRKSVKGLEMPKIKHELQKQSQYYNHVIIAVRYCLVADLFYIYQVMAFDGVAKMVGAECINQIDNFIKDYKAITDG